MDERDTGPCRFNTALPIQTYKHENPTSSLGLSIVPQIIETTGPLLNAVHPHGRVHPPPHPAPEAPEPTKRRNRIKKYYSNLARLPKGISRRYGFDTGSLYQAPVAGYTTQRPKPAIVTLSSDQMIVEPIPLGTHGYTCGHVAAPSLPTASTPLRPSAWQVVNGHPAYWGPFESGTAKPVQSSSALQPTTLSYSLVPGPLGKGAPTDSSTLTAVGPQSTFSRRDEETCIHVPAGQPPELMCYSEALALGALPPPYLNTGAAINMGEDPAVPLLDVATQINNRTSFDHTLSIGSTAVPSFHGANPEQPVPANLFGSSDDQEGASIIDLVLDEQQGDALNDTLIGSLSGSDTPFDMGLLLRLSTENGLDKPQSGSAPAVEVHSDQRAETDVAEMDGMGRYVATDMCDTYLWDLNESHLGQGEDASNKNPAQALDMSSLIADRSISRMFEYLT